MSTATIYIGLLRAVNLAGRNLVEMKTLRDLLTRLGMRDVQTLLQSGNVVFRSDSTDASEVERTLEAACATQFTFETDIFVRTASEWRTVIAQNPFPDDASRDPGHLVVLCLKSAPTPAHVAALQDAIAGREVVRAIGRHAYVTYPDGIGRSKVTNVFIEKKLGARCTARNWNTVTRLHTLANAM